MSFIRMMRGLPRKDENSNPAAGRSRYDGFALQRGLMELQKVKGENILNGKRGAIGQEKRMGGLIVFTDMTAKGDVSAASLFTIQMEKCDGDSGLLLDAGKQQAQAAVENLKLALVEADARIGQAGGLADDVLVPREGGECGKLCGAVCARHARVAQRRGVGKV